MPRNRNDLLVGTAENVLDSMKFEIAEELGNFPKQINSGAEFQQAVDQFKFEIASELGIPLRPGYNGDIRARDAGRIGGRIGGKLGGQMVKRMITLAEQTLAGQTTR